MEQFKPPHPGEILKEFYIKPLNIKHKVLAKGLNITPKALSELVNGHTGMSTIMALKLAEAFNTTPESWLNLQQNYNLFQEKRKRGQERIHHFFKGESKAMKQAH